MIHRNDGYTIVEALVAFAILSIVLVALFGVAGTSLRLTDKASQVQRIAMLANSKLDELASVREPLAQKTEGDFPGTGVTWKAVASDMPSSVKDSHVHLQQVELELRWQEGLRSRALTFETRHLGTTWP